MSPSGLLRAVIVDPRFEELWSDRAVIAAMLAVEACLAECEAEFRLAPDGLAAAIRSIAPEAFEPEVMAEEARRSAVPTIAFLEALSAQLPPHLASALHRGATSQDLLDSALALLVARSLRRLAEELASALDALAALAARHAGLVCLGRTYGQAAAPTTFGARAGQWALGLAEPAAELPDLLRSVPAVSLGGPVGIATAFGESAPLLIARLASRLGLAAEPLAWHGRRWRIARVGFWLAGVVGAAAKVARDLSDLRAEEVGEIVERGGGGGSSAMPHKRNPASETAILAAQHLAPSLAASLLAAMAVAQERGGGGWQAEWQALPQLCLLAGSAVSTLGRLTESVLPEERRIAANLAAARGLVFAERAAEASAQRLGRKGAREAVSRAAESVRAGAFASLAEALRAAGHEDAALACSAEAAAAAGERFAHAAAARARETAATLRRAAAEGRET